MYRKNINNTDSKNGGEKVIEAIGTVSMIMAVAGVILNNRKISFCFYLWIISNLLSAGLHFESQLYSLMVRDVIFFALAIEGLFKWRKAK